MGERTGCALHHLASKLGHLLGTALRVGLALAGLPEDTLMPRVPASPSKTTNQEQAVGWGWGRKDRCHRANRTSKTFRKPLGLGLAGLHQTGSVGLRGFGSSGAQHWGQRSVWR